MFNMKDLGDLTKIAGQAQEMERQQTMKHKEQVQLLTRIAGTLDDILKELRKNNAK